MFLRAALDPRRVLEIGCGTGLVLFRIAPRCDLYVGTDDEPALAGDVRDFVADELGVPRPAPTWVEEPHGRRMLNTRLRSSGLELRYPTYREGYRAQLLLDR